MLSYIFNTSIQSIEESDLILLIGCNPRHEATIINARIRKAFVKNKILGYKVDMQHFLRESPKEDFYNQVYKYEIFEDLGMERITKKIRKEFTEYLAHSRQVH